LRKFLLSALAAALSFVLSSCAVTTPTSEIERRPAITIKVVQDSKGIKFETSARVEKLSVYIQDPNGRRVFEKTVLFDYHLDWLWQDCRGDYLPAGVYFYRIVATSASEKRQNKQSGKLVLEKEPVPRHPVSPDDFSSDNSAEGVADHPPSPFCALPPSWPQGYTNRRNFENFWRFTFDQTGVLMAYFYAIGWFYNPVAIANYALALYGAWYQGDSSAFTPMLIQVDWLFRNSVLRHDKSRGGFYTFEYPFEHDVFKAPAGWTSALAASRAMQALFLIGRAISNQAYVERARRFLLPFEVRIERGGYRSSPFVDSRRYQAIWYEEVAHPKAPPAHILNGHMYTILELLHYALLESSQRVSQRARRLYEEGVRGLQMSLALYDSDGLSKYDLMTNAVNCTYHTNGHIPLLKKLYEFTEIEIFRSYAERWSSRPCTANQEPPAGLPPQP
jgi:hypothetical protein